MTALLTLLALVCLVAIGVGAGLLRGTERAAIAPDTRWRQACAWAHTLQGHRAVGFCLAVAAVLLFVVILIVRP